MKQCSSGQYRRMRSTNARNPSLDCSKRKAGQCSRVLVTFQQRFRDEACDVLEFPDIYPDVEGLSLKHGQDIQIRRCSCSLCHGEPLPTRLPYQMNMRWWVERPGLVDVACPVTHEKLKLAFIQMRMKDFTHIPQLPRKGSASK